MRLVLNSAEKDVLAMDLSARISAVAIAAMIAFAPLALNVSTPAFAQEPSDFITNAEFIKGHLEQATANKEAGNVELAIAHAGHPIDEVFTLMEEPLSDANPQLAADLKAKLTALPNAANSDTSQAFKQKTTEITGLIDEAVKAVAGEKSTDAATLVAVISNLLETAENEYEEGVKDGKIVEMVEYQDSTAFIARAEAVFDSIKTQVPTHEAEEAEEFFGQLNSLTKANSSLEEVKIVIGGIVNELEEGLGLEKEEETKLDGWGYIAKINELLDQAAEEYEEGNTQKARALAVEAYLDNYENIESDIDEDNPQLMEKIEIDMRVNLVKMIDDGRPVDEVKAHISMIKADLETAKAVVTPEFPVTIAIIVVVMASAIAVTRFRGSIFRPSI